VRCRGASVRQVAESPIARTIAQGHAFEKHVLNQGQFPNIFTPEQFAIEIQRIIDNPSVSKQLARGRTAYWEETTGIVVIYDPHAPDGGTTFKPHTGRSYYDNLR
jgi:filamentous hemagglutinin